MKPDISTRPDIEKLITEFYERVKPDPVIGHIFTQVVAMNWETHIPVIVDFWETILLDNPVYKKNAMEVHYDLHKHYPLTGDHFRSWLQLFTTTVDDLFEGKTAELAKKRARSIADVMKFKMIGVPDKNSLL